MIVYNITIQIDPAIEKPWLQWQKEEHIPEIMATGLFTNHKMFRLLEQDETQGMTFVIQFFADNATNYERYVNDHATVLRDKSFAKWGDAFIAFRTVMEVVN
jgi:hypothetical protein